MSPVAKISINNNVYKLENNVIPEKCRDADFNLYKLLTAVGILGSLRNWYKKVKFPILLYF